MATYPRDLNHFALKKESSRGTAETTPAKYLKISRDSFLSYGLEHVPNENIQGIVAGELQPDAGRKVGTGQLKFDLEALTIGEFLYSLLGSYTGTQDGATTAYTHTFSKTTSTQHQAYTLFMDRGVDAFKFAQGQVKRMEISVDNRGKAMVTADMLFKSEASVATWSPTIATPDPLMFHEVDVEVDNSSIGARVKRLNLVIDNQAEAQYLYNQSQNLADIIVAKKLLVEGGFDMYFTSTAERDDFLANTARKLEFNINGATITGGSKYRLLASVYGARYTAVPFDTELEHGLLGASVAFKGFYSISDSKALDIIIGNTTTTY